MHIEAVGEVVRLERQRIGMTQAALAEAAEVSRSCLEAVENGIPAGPGRRKSVSWPEVCSILSAVGIEVVLQKQETG